MSETVEIPLSLLEKLAEAGAAFRELDEEIEAFLIARDPELLARLEAARASHLAGQLRPFGDVPSPS